jgi:hypothetical protein
MELVSGGTHGVPKVKRAQILLAADAGATDEDIALSVNVSGSTVAQRSTGPNAASLKAIWKPRSVRSRVPALSGNSRPRRRRFR